MYPRKEAFIILQAQSKKYGGKSKQTDVKTKTKTNSNVNNSLVKISAGNTLTSTSRSQGKTLIPITESFKEDDLSIFGYSDIIHKTMVYRHKALEDAIKAYGELPVLRKLNLLAVLNKHSNPELTKILDKDRDWISTKHEKEKEKSKSKSKSTK